MLFESYRGSPTSALSIFTSLRSKIPSTKLRTLNRLAIIAYCDDLNYPRDILSSNTIKEMFLAYRNQYLEALFTPSDLELIHQRDFKPQQTIFIKSQQIEEDVNQIIYSHLSSELNDYEQNKDKWKQLINEMREIHIPELEARFVPSLSVRYCPFFHSSVISHPHSSQQTHKRI